MMRRFAVQTIPGFVPLGSGAYECPLVYPSVFSTRQCDRIVGLAQDLETDAAYVGDGIADDEHHDEIRSSRIAWLPPEEPFTWVYDKLAAVVQRANRRYDFDLIGFTEELQFTEYDGTGAFYTWHQDGLDGELATRKLSLVVQLSDPDDYEGGALEFFAHSGEADATENRRTEFHQRGTVIAFPAFEYHRVTPLTSGTRRSLVCWVGGPPFR